MRLLGFELHTAALIEGLIVIWIGELLDWEIKNLRKHAKALRLLVNGMILEIVIELEGFK